MINCRILAFVFSVLRHCFSSFFTVTMMFKAVLYIVFHWPEYSLPHSIVFRRWILTDSSCSYMCTCKEMMFLDTIRQYMTTKNCNLSFFYSLQCLDHRCTIRYVHWCQSHVRGSDRSDVRARQGSNYERETKNNTCEMLSRLHSKSTHTVVTRFATVSNKVNNFENKHDNTIDV
jgi:hypothetical protein